MAEPIKNAVISCKRYAVAVISHVFEFCLQNASSGGILNTMQVQSSEHIQTSRHRYCCRFMQLLHTIQTLQSELHVTSDSQRSTKPLPQDTQQERRTLHLIKLALDKKGGSMRGAQLGQCPARRGSGVWMRSLLQKVSLACWLNTGCKASSCIAAIVNGSQFAKEQLLSLCRKPHYFSHLCQSAAYERLRNHAMQYDTSVHSQNQ